MSGSGYRFAMRIEWLTFDGRLARATVPDNVMPFVKLLGIHTTAKMILELGGVQLSAGRSTSRVNGRLAQVIGTEDAAKVGELYLGGRITLPTAPTFLVQYLRSQQLSCFEIARKLSRHERSVRRVLNDPSYVLAGQDHPST